MLPLNLYQSLEPAWCPGCGNFGILTAFKKALADLEIRPQDGVAVRHRPVRESPPLPQV
jgi:2-oxoglutarate ferredoxin oxidoreductase subunit beta